ncbi:ABC transporter substrate-binding protein [Brucella pituitosa]|uniref:ABC transporter substrate-binding protein n=1 Tax=Brucella pituitosa TaxID=571256 RepID=UPI003F4AF43A
MNTSAFNSKFGRVVQFGVAACATLLISSASFAAQLGLIEDKTITVAVNATFAPIVSLDDKGKYVGVDADIIEAIAKELGVKVTWVNIKFDGIIPGVIARRFDVGMTGVTDTVEREQSVGFVNYANVGTGIIVQGGNPKGIKTLDDVCGLIVASQTGDLATTFAKRQSKKCVDENRKQITINEFPEDAQSLLQLQSGRADLVMHDYPISAYKAEKSGGKLALAGSQFSPEPYGMVIGKNNEDLRNALMRGLDAIIANGEYKAILDKHGLAEIGIDKATYNAASK